MKTLYSITLFLLVISQVVHSQVLITSTPSTYAQDFNTLSNSGTSNLWLDNITLPGWYSSENDYRAGTGSSTAGGLYSFGASSSTERTLGGIATGTTAPLRYGIRFINNSGGCISSFAISYTGEQWRDASSDADVLNFQYQLNASMLSSGVWTGLSSLDFTSPSNTGSNGTDMDGSTLLSDTLIIVVADGDEIWFRWEDTDDFGFDHGLGIDDLTITALQSACACIQVNLYATGVSCASGGNNGIITAIASGGASPYAYIWNTGQTSSIVAGLSVGSYSITITDTLGCTANGSTSVPLGNDSWAFKGLFTGSERGVAVSFSIGNKGYTGTGYDGSYKKDFWEFDPASNVWTQKADFGGIPRYGATGFSLGGSGYIGAGWDDAAYQRDFWRYDPSLNSWTQIADFGGTERSYAVGFSIADKGYVGTGYDGSYLRDFWEYDPSTDIWTQKADFTGTNRYRAVGFSLGGKGHIGTGWTGSGYANDFKIYDPNSDSWAPMASLGTAGRNRAVAITIGNKGYVGTGWNGSTYLSDFWEYDPSLNSWLQKSDFLGGNRGYMVGFSIGSKGYLGMGYTGSFWMGDIWEYDHGQGFNLTVTENDASCSGANNGSASIALTGGTPPYSFQWSNGQTDTLGTGLTAGVYFVTIVDSGACTDVAIIDIAEPPPLDSQLICLVTVDSTSSKNFIVWEKQITSGIDSFRIYREIGLNNYVYIGGVSYSETSEFLDTTNGVNPNVQSYKYKISVIDTCGGESPLSEHHRTIHLSTPQFTPPGTFDLIWTNDYEGFPISQYYVLRDGNNTGNWVRIDSVTFGNLSYTDINAPSVNARYIIEAAHPNGCTADKKGKNYNSSVSNSSILSVVGYDELQKLETLLQVYPNPSTGKFIIEFETLNSKLKNVSLRVYDALGKKILNSKIANQKYEVDLSKQPLGIYQLEIITEYGVIHKQVVIR